MGGEQMLLERMTWPEVRRADVGEMVVVLPTGSFEQHGPHLPFTVDADLVGAVARGVEGRLPGRVLLLPTLWPGMSTHHNAFPGTLDVSQETYMRLVRDLVASAVRMGARKVFILNGHGGNDVPIRAAMREMKTEHPEVRVVFASYWQLGEKAIRGVRTSEMGGLGHACEMETAMMLHLHPERVKMELARRDGPAHQDVYRKADMQFSRPVYFVNEFHEVTESGVVGWPEVATGEKGKRFYEGIVGAVVEFVEHYLTWEEEAPRTRGG
jgi:creatinine amidohydrolase